MIWNTVSHHRFSYAFKKWIKGKGNVKILKKVLLNNNCHYNGEKNIIQDTHNKKIITRGLNKVTCVLTFFFNLLEYSNKVFEWNLA